MRYRISSLASALLICCAMGCRSGGARPSSEVASRDEQAVRAVLQEWLSALERADMKSLERIIAEDYRITVADGRVLNREQDLEPIRTGKLRFKSAKVEDVDVRFIGDDAAVVTGRGTYEVVSGNRTITVRERFTDVYAERKGRWQPVASHSTPLR
jgi:uncharacterized protein (TIGR02246 family)